MADSESSRHSAPTVCTAISCIDGRARLPVIRHLVRRCHVVERATGRALLPTMRGAPLRMWRRLRAQPILSATAGRSRRRRTGSTSDGSIAL